MMKHLVVLLFCIVIVGCSVTPEPTMVADDVLQEKAQATAQPISTSTVNPTDTPEPLPTSEPTLAPISSPTPFQLAGFDPQIERVDPHGMMLNLNYQGDIEDLGKKRIWVHTSQRGVELESNIKLEENFDSPYVELKDARYELGEIVVEF